MNRKHPRSVALLTRLLDLIGELPQGPCALLCTFRHRIDSFAVAVLCARTGSSLIPSPLTLLETVLTAVDR